MSGFSIIRSCILLLTAHSVICHGYTSAVLPAVTSTPGALAFRRHNETELGKRDVTSTQLSTCGYFNGNPTLSRTAAPGYDCRIDTKNGLWGFCPTTVSVATDCGLAGSCVDDYQCSDGCGMTDQMLLTTFTCKTKAYCSTALLTFGVDQTYTYIACGAGPSTDHYMATPTSDSTVVTTSSDKPTSTTTTPSSSGSTSSDKPTSSTTSPSSSRSSSSIALATTRLALSSSAVLSSSALSQGTSTSQATASSTHGSSTNIGAIVGGVVGGLAVVCGTVIAAIYLLRRNSSRSNKEFEEGDGAVYQPPPPWEAEDSKPARHSARIWKPMELPAFSRRGPEAPVELAG